MIILFWPLEFLGVINMALRLKSLETPALMDCVDDLTTFSNCFKKAGFGQYSEWEEEDEVQLTFQSERLKEKSEEIQIGIEFKAWTNIREFPTDEDIIESCRSEPVQLNIEDDRESDTMEEELEDDSQQPPSNELVENSLIVLRSYLKTSEQLKLLLKTKIRNPGRQSQITDFFPVKQ
ncbi:uncharacterized protein LOC132706009 [Cylas formicarius]|uniref:uncharacterized protein LOC132706009 n=1 Tax=Cylas formicarius TaxID=197179 RepID=UPI002958A4D2|nr:uncharacterized protein LOC132706009 [Cylas formicarius]